MTIILFGGHGWIGSQLFELLKPNCIIPPKDIRVDNIETVSHYLDSFEKIDHVICCIGRTHGEGINNIDYLEQNGKLRENIRDNLFGPIALAFECYKRNIHYIFGSLI